MSESQTTHFDVILPSTKERLLDELPAEAFDYVKRESVEERLAKTEASEGLRLSCSVYMALRTGKSS